MDLEELKHAIKSGYHITLRESQELIAEAEKLKLDYSILSDDYNQTVIEVERLTGLLREGPNVRVSDALAVRLSNEVDKLREEVEKLKAEFNNCEARNFADTRVEKLREALERLKRINIHQAPNFHNRVTVESIRIIDEALKGE